MASKAQTAHGHAAYNKCSSVFNLKPYRHCVRELQNKNGEHMHMHAESKNVLRGFYIMLSCKVMTIFILSHNSNSEFLGQSMIEWLKSYK